MVVADISYEKKGFASAGSLEKFRATVIMCGRKYGLWRFFLLAWDVCELSQKLSLNRNYCFNFAQLFALHSHLISRVYSFFHSVRCLSVYEYIRTSKPCQQLPPGVRTLVLTAGCQRLPLGEREHEFSVTGLQSLLKGKLQLTYLQSNAK